MRFLERKKKTRYVLLYPKNFTGIEKVFVILMFAAYVPANASLINF